MTIFFFVILFVILLKTFNDINILKKKEETEKSCRLYKKELVELKKTLLDHEQAGINILANDETFHIVLDYKDDHPLANKLSRKQLFEHRYILDQVDNWCDRLDDIYYEVFDSIKSEIYDLCYDNNISVPDNISVLIRSCEIIIDRSRTIFDRNKSFCNECNESFCTTADIFCPECGK